MIASQAAGRPNFRFPGWRIVAALAFSTLVSYGVLFYAFGVVTRPMESEFGWSRFQTSIAFSLASLANGLASVWAGKVVDRSGARLLMTVGSISATLLVVAWSYVRSLTQLYLVWALIGLSWTATFYEVAFAVVAKWFRRDRSRATFSITMVAGFASTLFIPLTTALVDHHGWRRGLRILAVLLAVITVPLHALVLRRDPAAVGHPVDGVLAAASHVAEFSVPARQAQRGAVFWRLAIAFALARFVASAMSAHLVPLLRESAFSGRTASLVAGSIGPMQVFGRILFFPLHRRLTLRRLTIATFAMFTVAFGSLLIAAAFVTPEGDRPFYGGGVWMYVVLYGTANGIITLNRASITAERFGPAEFGRISGTMNMVGAVLSAAAPLTAGWLRTRFGNYRIVLVGLIVSVVIGGWAIRGIGEQADGQPRKPDAP